MMARGDDTVHEDAKTAPPSKKRKATTKKEAGAPAKKRGRPSKAAAAAAAPEDDDAEEPAEDAPVTTKKRGRPAKGAASKSPVAGEGKAAPKKRGRPPKGGETTKSHADEEAAEEQLEEELLDSNDAEGAEIGEPAPPPSSSNSKRYWLMKAEQEDREERAHNGTVINTKFTIDDLRSKTTAPELWDGVRNHVAAKNMRAMRKGELAFFYASGGKQGRTPGIVGIMEVVSEAEHDVTTADEGAYGYVGEEGKRGQWCVVGVEFRKKLSKPVSLKELQQHRGAGEALEKMQLFKQSRLSVAEVSAAEWDFIMEQLVEGYE
ncbi:hypothetical protein B0A55_08000 [Friedmanniomyces simplex]|uniref:EVE domain-containing protein n=1 Tax=Friedmanniomyces simplex TaxID=329884 RepID=A0A4U0X7E9_9PEZI|nr:hypothetical protein B0A55_08000 [Friedmanniomyces simplex]